jgi:hypothetical protein
MCKSIVNQYSIAAQQALAADRFAHEIRTILASGFGPHLVSIYHCGG